MGVMTNTTLFMGEIYSQPSVEQDAPPLSNLNIYLVDGCSQTCRNCRAATAAGLDPCTPMPTGQGSRAALPLKTIMQAVHEAMLLGLHTIRLTGGEPLLYPAFDELLESLEPLQRTVIIETNGHNLTPERAARMARLPQLEVVFRLEGADAATHDGISAQPGAFTTLVNAARLLADAGVATQFILNITRRTASQVPAAIRLAENLGATSLRFIAAQTTGLRLPAGSNGSEVSTAVRGSRDLNNNRPVTGRLMPLPISDVLAVEELIALGRRIEREMARTTHLHLVFDMPPAFRGLQPTASIDGLGRCNIRGLISLLPGGEYAMCSLGASRPDLIYGFAGKESLARIWREHPVLRTLRSGLPARLEGICDRCIMKTACLGNCAAENYLRTGSFWGPHWFCETAEKAGLFPAGRLIENRW